MEYTAVMEEGAEPVEIEQEENVSVSLAMLAGEFGLGLAGLSYHNPSILRTDGTQVNPPRRGWLNEVTYIITCQTQQRRCSMREGHRDGGQPSMKAEKV